MSENSKPILEESDALNQAAEEGIQFVDSYIIAKVGETTSAIGFTSFNTEEEAESHRSRMESPNDYCVVQQRERTQND